MTSLRRTVWTPLERPAAGELRRDEAGNLSVPIAVGPDEEFVVTDPAWSRDLMAAAAVVTSVLETALGLPAPSAPRCSCDDDPFQCAHQSRLGQVQDDRDAFRGLLARIVRVTTMPELQELLTEAREVLDRYDRRDVTRTEGGEPCITATT